MQRPQPQTLRLRGIASASHCDLLSHMMLHCGTLCFVIYASYWTDTKLVLQQLPQSTEQLARHRMIRYRGHQVCQQPISTDYPSAALQLQPPPPKHSHLRTLLVQVECLVLLLGGAPLHAAASWLLVLLHDAGHQSSLDHGVGWSLGRTFQAVGQATAGQASVG